MSSRRIFLAAAVATVLTGCVSVPLSDGATQWSGKFVLVPKKAPTQRESARFRLEQSEKTLRLELLGPLNTRLARLDVQEDEASLSQASGEILRAPSAEALMEKTLGFSLPLKLLLSWFQGVPWPEAPYVLGSADSFTQSGWHVEVLERTPEGQVRRLRLESQAVTLTLLVKKN